MVTGKKGSKNSMNTTNPNTETENINPDHPRLASAEGTMIIPEHPAISMEREH